MLSQDAGRPMLIAHADRPMLIAPMLIARC
jgi:hypothetical protein